VRTMNTPIPGGDPRPQIINLSEGHMVDHPAGAHYALWNGPAFLDVGVPAGGFVRFALANLTPQWTLLVDAQNRQLPTAVLYDRRGLAILWLPYDGPGARTNAQTGSKLTDADYAEALQKISGMRYQSMMGVFHKSNR